MVKFLTEFSSSPGLAVFAFRFAQTKTSLRPSSPHVSQAVGSLPTEKIKTCQKDSAYGKIPDGIFLQPGPRGFCLSLRSNKNIAPAFESPREPSSWLTSHRKNKNLPKGRFIFFTGEGTRTPKPVWAIVFETILYTSSSTPAYNNLFYQILRELT